MYVCKYINTFTEISICAPISMYVYTYVYLYAYVHRHVCLYVYMKCVCTYIHIHVCLHTYMHKYILKCVHTYTYKLMYVFLYTYPNISIHICISVICILYTSKHTYSMHILLCTFIQIYIHTNVFQ